MAHQRVFDVLDDLKSDAVANGQTALAAKAGEALLIASIGIAALEAGGEGGPRREPDPGTR